MAAHTLEEYHDLMPYIVKAFQIKGQFASDPILFKAVKSWLFMFNMIEELSDQECNAVHNMFWDCFNMFMTDGRMSQVMIQQSKDAVMACKQVDVTIGGDIIDLAIEMWEDAH